MEGERDRVDGAGDQVGAGARGLERGGERVAAGALAVEADRQAARLAQRRRRARCARCGCERAGRIVEQDARGAELGQLAAPARRARRSRPCSRSRRRARRRTRCRRSVIASPASRRFETSFSGSWRRKTSMPLSAADATKRRTKSPPTGREPTRKRPRSASASGVFVRAFERADPLPRALDAAPDRACRRRRRRRPRGRRSRPRRGSRRAAAARPSASARRAAPGRAGGSSCRRAPAPGGSLAPPATRAVPSTRLGAEVTNLLPDRRAYTRKSARMGARKCAESVCRCGRARRARCSGFSRGSTLIRSPTFTNSGTWTTAPVSSVAGFVTFETVSPRTPGSVSATASSTDDGQLHARGLAVDHQHLHRLERLEEGQRVLDRSRAAARTARRSRVHEDDLVAGVVEVLHAP